MRPLPHQHQVSAICSKVTMPTFHYKPLLRLEKPTFLESDNRNTIDKTAPLRLNRFHSIISRNAQRQRDLIYDPNNPLRITKPQFSGDFECGNLGQVFKVGTRSYEIHILPDPTRHYSALWYYFKVENLSPGEYTFIIVGFFRDAHLHKIGVQPTAFSENQAKDGIGWQRLGDNMNFWCWKKAPSSAEYALSFTFSVKETDTMHFSYLYPYSYSQMKKHISSLNPPYVSSNFCKSLGNVDVPIIFWDADLQRCMPIKASSMLSSQSILTNGRYSYQRKKPLIVITARHHPGESNSSYAMEGFIDTLFNQLNSESQRLLSNFSFLIIPMMNVDGVICGYYRPTLDGYDMNRTWIKPTKKQNPVEYYVVSLIDKLIKNRPLIFFLDFHGHTAQCNSFTYGVCDEDCELNEYEGVFPRLMAFHTKLFDENASTSFNPEAYPSTMRVALHHRYQIPFAYTLEMTFGGLDIGPKSFTQMTQQNYREIGIAVVPSIASMLIDHIPITNYCDHYYPPINSYNYDI
ncbi:Clan MC, family M14, Zinc carboxypeptidase-like metallopeptidase [Tritrichomonas foetus]|uniref:Clan MC, family M14, Zinc carboxypeptidase-like metallopeptidase n=1 Tax=Tritrichomonas foetus TaxID=1144522 RepID=A0A1J4KS86_9EUKA|nr:Clan MC, family M14, Zinc carboxypeptidase-like metallopeptidase [Tritrichomonas foetus]|eukprot:OHT13744.1 Clan MC, family M14, Zinc carboxypeptidase-like metallopeptidase [Tritrichomonas foetus]